MTHYLTFLDIYSLLGLGLALDVFTVTNEKNNDLVTKQHQMNNSMDTFTNLSDVTNEFESLENWSRQCNISQTGQTDFNIVCIVKSDSSIKLSEFKNFTYRVSSNIRFDLSVTCEDGIIHFPWPFRADKLNRIYIKDCRIKDYRTEYKNPLIDSIPDTIKYLQMENVTIIQKIREIYDSMSKANSPITRAAECGPENAFSIIKRRIKIIFEDMHNYDLFIDFGTVMKQYNHYFNTQKRSCLYKNLEVFEMSGMKDLKKNDVNKIVHTDVAKNLKILNFSYNGMFDTFYKLQGWRLRFPVMEYIDFSNNNVKVLPMIRDYGMSVKETKSVGIIDLRRNDITSLTKGMVDSFSTHAFFKVDISENPFLCDCGIIEVIEYLSSKTMPKAYDYLGSLECANPTNVRGRQLLSLSLTELNCNKETFINFPIVVMSIITITFFVIILLVIYLRDLFKIILFTRLNINCPCEFKNDINEEKDYDAFIAYSEKDADWVIRTALPKLESDDAGKACRLCLHHRDFVVGNTIADNIFNSVGNSHHTILLVSSEFLKSEWCMMEFRTALRKNLHDKGRHLIIVLKGNITLDNVDPDLKSFLNSHTYLKIGDVLFWDRLKYAISLRNNTRQNN
ncbi:toll-like receptor 2 type-2 [Mytilus californianus]|uniref:toll-like receptor 2 type-2 n=1 Tax=Mytilus californianus TaxID=6549 RepID=UPI0022476451|nr:toll-like receptor 2 type-2 [Mytilus californianus]